MFRTESLVPHRPLVDRSFSTIAFWQHVGILGTNEQIRQQALSMLRHNIQGTSDIMIAMDFKLPQDYLLGLIGQAILRPHFDVVDRFTFLCCRQPPRCGRHGYEGILVVYD